MEDVFKDLQLVFDADETLFDGVSYGKSTNQSIRAKYRRKLRRIYPGVPDSKRDHSFAGESN